MYCIVPGKCPWALKHQKVRVGGYMEEVLEWFNYPVQAAILDVKLAARVYIKPAWWRKRTDL